MIAHLTPSAATRTSSHPSSPLAASPLASILQPLPCSPVPRRTLPPTRPRRHAAPPPCGCSSNIRRPKDPKAFSSMDALREHLERGEVAPSAPGEAGAAPGRGGGGLGFQLPLPTITGVIKFMGQVNTSEGSKNSSFSSAWWWRSRGLSPLRPCLWWG